jgi:hypothetical protein
MMVMVMVMVMMMVMMTGNSRRGLRVSGDRRRILTRDLVEYACHRLTGSGGDSADAVRNPRHDAGDRVLSGGDLGHKNRDRKPNKRSDSNFLHDFLSVNVLDCIICRPKIISHFGNVHRCLGNAMVATRSDH